MRQEHYKTVHWLEFDIVDQDMLGERKHTTLVEDLETGSRTESQSYISMQTGPVFASASTSAQAHFESYCQSKAIWHMERKWALVGLSFLD